MGKRRDRGQVLVFAALAIPVFLGLAALAVDIGFLYCTRHELQRSADAGAHAGAVEFTTPGANWNLPGTRTQSEARAKAFASASGNTVVQTQLDPDAEVRVTFPRANQIQVDVSRNVNLFFAGIFGMPNRTVTAYAVAGVSGTPPVVRLVE
jgi:uncharacterized membrane protein